MKKLLFILITVSLTLLCSTQVKAQTLFYEGEYIDGIYMNKQKTEISAIYYSLQKEVSMKKQ